MTEVGWQEYCTLTTLPTSDFRHLTSDAASQHHIYLPSKRCSRYTGRLSLTML